MRPLLGLSRLSLTGAPMPDFLERERQEFRERVARFSQAETDPCLCRKGGDSGEDCPWKCPPYRPAEPDHTDGRREG